MFPVNSAADTVSKPPLTGFGVNKREILYVSSFESSCLPRAKHGLLLNHPTIASFRRNKFRLINLFCGSSRLENAHILFEYNPFDVIKFHTIVSLINKMSLKIEFKTILIDYVTVSFVTCLIPNRNLAFYAYNDIDISSKFEYCSSSKTTK